MGKKIMFLVLLVGLVGIGTLVRSRPGPPREKVVRSQLEEGMVEKLATPARVIRPAKRPKPEKIHSELLERLKEDSPEYSHGKAGLDWMIHDNIKRIMEGQRAKSKKIKIHNLYRLTMNCEGGPVYVFYDADLVPIPLTKVKEDQDDQFTGSSGSGGATLTVYRLKDKTPEVLMSETVLGFGKVKGESDCPEITVQLHGSAFDSVGSDSGVAVYSYRQGKYKVNQVKVGGEMVTKEYKLIEE